MGARGARQRSPVPSLAKTRDLPLLVYFYCAGTSPLERMQVNGHAGCDAIGSLKAERASSPRRERKSTTAGNFQGYRIDGRQISASESLPTHHQFDRGHGLPRVIE